MATQTFPGASHSGPFNVILRPSLPSVPLRKLIHRRDLTDDARIGKIYSFEDIKAVAGKDKNITIVDSREPHEIESLGRIPGAVNIPIDSAPDAFMISEEDFEERFGFDRPAKDTHIITYCRAGVRCHTAAQLAKQAGFKNVNEYPGSFLDWVANNGELERK